MNHALTLFNDIHTAQQQADNYAQKIAVLKRYDDFLIQFPDLTQGRLNRSILLQELGLYELALYDVNAVLAAEPERAEAWCHKAFLLNLMGRYTEGWRCYEWRWQLPNFNHPTDQIPAWQGEEIGAARLLIYAEQGFGDNIQFMRYALAAKARGLNIVVVNHSPLENLLNYNLALHGVETAPNGGQVSNVQYLVSMMSLPHYFGTTVETIPYAEPYLRAEPHAFAKFQQKLTACNRLKVGIVWAGSPKHRRNASRSLNLAQLSLLFELNAEFHCLQKEISAEDLARAEDIENLHLWHTDLADFSDTASLIAQLDLVISVDTSVAHLAAAMGVPTWILVSYNPDYRWLLNRTDSPWYQGVTLFRQREFDHWHSTLSELYAQLAARIG